MKINFNQFKKLLFEDLNQLPIVDYGNVLLLKPSEKQKELSFGYPGYVFVHKDQNPEFDKNLPYILIVHEVYPKTNEDYGWQLHYRGIEKEKISKDTLDDLYSAIADFLPNGFRIEATGKMTPGGLAGISE